MSDLLKITSMKVYLQAIFLCVLSTCIISVVKAQSPTKKQYIIAAEKETAVKNYYGALVYLEEALAFDKNDPEVIFRYAESARMFNAYTKASRLYQYLVDTLSDDSRPEAIFWLASMKQRTGDYNEADKYFDMYLSEHGGADSLFTARAKKEKASLAFAKKIAADSSRHAKLEKLGDDVNTNSSEVAGNMHGSNFYFSSMRFNEQNPLQGLPREISKILVKQGDSLSVPLPGFINNRDLLVSNSCMNSDGTKMYYTVCEYMNASDIRCAIYRCDIDKQGNLSNEEKLAAPVNLTGTTSTHPFISMDERSGREILYFVSDRPGGLGGLDIWYSFLDARLGFSEPVNIAEINTPDNEITPFYSANSDFLYFSADGRMGLGGYDVFKAGKINDAFGSPVHIGVPVNSSYNDIYYSEDEEGEVAWFSSNRAGTYYLEDQYEACCYDIYKVDVSRIDLNLQALVFDLLTQRPLTDVTVTIQDSDTGEEIAKLTNKLTNEINYPLVVDRNYTLITERQHYNPDTTRFSTLGLKESGNIVRKIYLRTDSILLDAYTYTKIGKLPLPGTTVTISEVGKPSQNDVVTTNPDSNDFLFFPGKGKLYTLKAEKEGYETVIDTLDTRPYTTSVAIRRDLYLDKFILQDLLPISLYFDNDLPDIASRKTTTDSKYGELVGEYLQRKGTYKQKYAGPLKGSERSSAEQEFEIFFEGDVKGGYDKFRLFINSLLNELKAGNKVELVLKGFASPRADAKYNLALGQRRVNAVKNELMYYGDDELKQYFLSGQLVLTDISFGKELAPKDVVSDLKDERNSIYNLRAAKERRVQILRATRNTNSN
jgi:hypothetical protein